MPDAALLTAKGKPWYSDEELEVFRLSSKTMMDVPVRTPAGETVHMICAHPTPPVFDGKEDRNGKRNHDEIRLIADYIGGEAYIYDDTDDRTPFPADSLFVILGDMNADPDEGDSYNNPIMQLLGHDRVVTLLAPSSTSPERIEGGLSHDDTSSFGLRVDYVLPSKGLICAQSRIIERVQDTAVFSLDIPDPQNPKYRVPSDHFPVVLDLLISGDPGR